jgi:hypothetical protein
MNNVLCIWKSDYRTNAEQFHDLPALGEKYRTNGGRNDCN